MKYIHQFFIIIAVTFLGEVCYRLLPFPIPASIYGLLLMLLFLRTGLIPVEKIKDTAQFLLKIMPVMFIPAGAGLIAAWKDLSVILVPVMAVILLTTGTVMAAAGKTTQWMMHLKDGKKGE